MGQVMTNATTALHQLHLLLVNTKDSSVRVGITIQADHETVAQRCHLEIIADTGHRTACRDDILEMIQEIEDFLGADRILVFLLDTGNLVSNTPMHVGRTLLIDITETVFHGVLVHPHTGGQLITTKVFQRSLKRFLIRVCLLIHRFDIIYCILNDC